MAMMAMTTSSSMRVKARRRPMIGVLLPQRGRTAAGAPVGLPRSPSGSRCAEDLLPGNQPRTGRHLSEDEWGALLLEARLGNRHCVRAILQVDVNRLARVVPGVAIRGQKVASPLMEKGPGELVTVVPSISGGAIPRRIRPLPGLIPLNPIAGFSDDLGVGWLYHRCLGDPAATAGLAARRIAQERAVEVVTIRPAALLVRVGTLDVRRAVEDPRV